MNNIHSLKYKLKYLYYRFVWNIAPYLRLESPVHIDIEPNNNCNQKCVMCWHSDPENLPFKNATLPKKKVFKILEEGRAIGALSVKFNLRGEPTIYKDIRSVVKYASELGYTDIMINTNGQCEFGKLLSILEAGVTTCIISVDSFKKESYCKIHNCSPSHYNRLLKNLYKLKHLHIKKELNTKIKLNYHINTINEHDSLDLYKRAFKCFNLMVRGTAKREGEDISHQEYRKRKKYCPHMHRRLTITANGNIYPCCICWSEPEDIKLGHIDDGLEDIWRGHEHTRLIYSYKHKIFPKSCAECSSNDIYSI